MRGAVDRALVAQLLLDESLSYREIARRADCSDWSVRSIARQLDSEEFEDVASSEPLTGFEWCAILGIVALVIGGLSFAAWRQR
jgi:hypothetical protein